MSRLIRLLGDVDSAEEAVQGAYVAALVAWPREGVPENPAGWIVVTARRQAIDRARREGRRAAVEANGAGLAAAVSGAQAGDDRLRLIFTCCHPSLSTRAQVGLTLRLLGGLTVPEIARAFLIPESTMAQCLVRAKRKIKDAGIPYRVPDPETLPERLDAVLAVIYLIFNEGYYAAQADSLVRQDLCREAIRLGRTLVELMPFEPEAIGLLALMLLQDSRRAARQGPDGELVLLENQQRARWDWPQIAEGTGLLERALRRTPHPGPHVLQAAIAALHAQADSREKTDWRQIALLYARLMAVAPSPVIELNRAVAVAMAGGPAAGLAIVEAIDAEGTLAGYHLLPAVKGHLLRRMEHWSDAAAAYSRALELPANRVERRHIEQRLAECRRHLIGAADLRRQPAAFAAGCESVE